MRRVSSLVSLVAFVDPSLLLLLLLRLDLQVVTEATLEEEHCIVLWEAETLVVPKEAAMEVI